MTNALSFTDGKTNDTLSAPNVEGQTLRKMVEIYSSVKGEGTQSGMPMTFVRYAGCNLACSWCDTPYNKTAFMVTDEQLIEIIMLHEPAWVVFTGGEPTMQLSLTVTQALKSNGVKMAIESNGQMWNEALMDIDYVCFSPKRFRSAGVPTKYLLHSQIVEHANEAINFKGQLARPFTVHELRYVIESKEDSPVLADCPSDFITFSPLMHDQNPSPTFESGQGYSGRFGTVDAGAYNRCLELVKEHRHRGGRLSVQLHKFIGVR